MEVEAIEQEDIQSLMRTLGQRARHAYRVLAGASADQKNTALREAARSIRNGKRQILAANEMNTALAREVGLGDALLDRLGLNADRIEAMAKGLDEVASLPDPVGRIVEQRERPNG